MRIDIISAVPELLTGPFNSSIIKKGIEKKIVDIHIHNLRDYSVNNYKSVDDYQYGGGAGMVMLIEPIDNCISKLKKIKTVGYKSATFQAINFNNASQPYYVLMNNDLRILNTPIQYTSKENYLAWLKEGLNNL